MKQRSLLLSLGLVAALGACKDQGPEITEPTIIPLTSEFADALVGQQFTFADLTGFMDGRLAGGPWVFTYTTATTWKFEGKGRVEIGNVQYVAESSSLRMVEGVSGPALAADGPLLNPLLQNQLWWFGTPNPTPPPGTQVWEFEPLAQLPGNGLAGWLNFGQWSSDQTNLNFNVACLGTSIGPYGTGTIRTYNCP